MKTLHVKSWDASMVFPKPNTEIKITPRVVSNFWKKIVKFQSGCWKWSAHKTNKGYGRVNAMGTKVLAHRLSWIIHFGAIPDGLCVLHKCDNPPCCNPEHLRLGTVLDNIKDRDSKGRQVTLGGNQHWSKKHPDLIKKGSRHHNSKLSDYDVVEIRRLYKTGMYSLRQIAKSYGVSFHNIWVIVKRKAWSHLP